VGLRLVNVVGELRDPDQSPAIGTLTFTRSEPILDLAGNVVVEPIPIEAELDDAGAFSIRLYANAEVTGDTYADLYGDLYAGGYVGRGFYRVAEHIKGQRVGPGYALTVPDASTFNVAARGGAAGTPMTPISVHGTLRDPAGHLAEGQVEFEMLQQLRDGETCVSAAVVFAPVRNGALTPTTLYATNNPGVLPAGARYQVTERLIGLAPVVRPLRVPFDSAAGVLEYVQGL
jgi:hypothetical protein